MQYIEGIVAAASRKYNGCCLVVFDLNQKRFFRIISDKTDRIDGELVESECFTTNYEMVKLLDVVKVPVKSIDPIIDEYQHENLLLGGEQIEFVRHTNKNELIELCGNPNASPEIFVNRFGFMTLAETKYCNHSFMFARVFGLEFYNAINSKGEECCKCRFKYNMIEYKDISVTISKTKEEDILKYANKKKYPVAYVCFSFGHPYEGKCFKYLCSFLGYTSRY